MADEDRQKRDRSFDEETETAPSAAKKRRYFFDEERSAEPALQYRQGRINYVLRPEECICTAGILMWSPANRPKEDVLPCTDVIMAN